MRLLTFLILFILVSCSEQVEKYSQEDTIINAKGKGEKSTTAGNLITTAVRRVHKLDAVLYPADFIESNAAGLFTSDRRSEDTVDILNNYTNDKAKDQLRIGNMSGKDIKEFIIQRSREKYELDLEVSGVRYDLTFKGGVLISESFSFENGQLEDDRNYLVAISNAFMRPGGHRDIFPPYEFRNSIDRFFVETNKIVSARDSVKTFLSSGEVVPRLNRIRARVKNTKAQNHGFKSISKIQGISFMSPYYGDIVTTQGIVIAFSKMKDLPGGYVAYIQSQAPDNDDRTSEGIKLYFKKNPSLNVGDLVKVTGTVYEETGNPLNTLTTTSIRKITNIQVFENFKDLPPAVLIGKGGRKIPDHHHSTYVGNLSFKASLNLKDGIDFWESLEGMRVKISNPRIVGFRGGKETYDNYKTDPERGHLTLYVMPENTKKTLTPSGGIMADPDSHNFNPEIISIGSGELTVGLKFDGMYKIGDIIPGEIEGMVTFTKNLFGEGEYRFQLPQESPTISAFNDTLETELPDEEKEKLPKFEAALTDDSLVIASYNIKNLSSIGKDRKRLQKTGEMINSTLKCPDVLGLVEIQDNNGKDFSGTSKAEKTIADLISYVPKTGDCEGVDYVSVNINPLSHREGGIPGANIRVALIYNQNRLGFKENPAPTPLTETLITPDGHLNYNPGRIYPNSEAFQHTRKSIIAEFTFKGKQLFVIVNHFNSKLSDSSHFSATQPVVNASEIKRAKMAEGVNRFVTRLEARSAESLVAVIGDFNAFLNEFPMKVLEGNNLHNLMRTIPKNDRYTTNHNGNLQSLDYIFVNKQLKKHFKSFQVPQINSDYMDRLSDHDPVISIFQL